MGMFDGHIGFLRLGKRLSRCQLIVFSVFLRMAGRRCGET